MKRSPIMDVTSAGRSLRVLVTSAMLFAALAVTSVVISPSAALAATSVQHADATSVFYTTSGAGTGLQNGAEIFAITVNGAAVTTRDIGTTYAVGDCNPDPATFECNTPSSPPDLNYNSLYKVNVKTGAFTRIGPTGAPQFFMDLTLDRYGNMLGVTTTLNPTSTPAILYRIDLATGTATPLFNLTGPSNYVMGLAFGRDGKLYATDNFNPSGLYVIDTKTGAETTIAALPFGFSSDLVLMNPDE